MSKNKELDRLKREIAKAMKFKRDDTKLCKLAEALWPVNTEAYLTLLGTARYIAHENRKARNSPPDGLKDLIIRKFYNAKRSPTS